MAITINFKWLLQIIAATAIVVYSFWKLEARIQELERNMVLALEEIELHEAEREIRTGSCSADGRTYAMV